MRTMKNTFALLLAALFCVVSVTHDAVGAYNPVPPVVNGVVTTNGVSFQQAANVLAGTNYVSIGASPATTGLVRLPSATFAEFRSVSGLSDIPLFGTDTADTMFVGTDTTFTNQVPALDLYGSSSVYLGNGGLTRLALTAAGVNIYAPGDPLTFGYTGAADAGTIRLPNIADIKFRNAAGTGNVAVINTDSSNQLFIGVDHTAGWNDLASSIYAMATNQVVLGTSSTPRLVADTTGVWVQQPGDPLTFGYTGAASTGLVRLPAASDFVIRNNAGTGDINLIHTATDSILIGDSAAISSLSLYANTTALWGTVNAGIYNTSGSGWAILVNASTAAFSLPITQGTNPAASGIIRLPNGKNALAFRNSGNTADQFAIATDSTNVYVGQDNALSEQFAHTQVGASSDVILNIGASTVADFASATISIGNLSTTTSTNLVSQTDVKTKSTTFTCMDTAGTATRFQVDSTNIKGSIPYIGTANAPYGAHGKTTIATSGTLTVAAANYIYDAIQFTSATSVAATFPSPVNDAGAYYKTIIYSGNSSMTVNDTLPVGSVRSCTLSTNSTLRVLFDSNGCHPVGTAAVYP